METAQPQFNTRTWHEAQLGGALLVRSMMAACKTFARVLSGAILSRTYYCSPIISAGQQWRLRYGKSRSGTEYGPLTDLPDWSYEDGRPAPPSKGQLRRSQMQRTINERIWRLISEMDQAQAVNVGSKRNQL